MLVYSSGGGGDVLLVYFSGVGWWRRFTAGLLKLGEEQIYCWCTQVLDKEMYCWCTQVGRGGDVLLVYSSVGMRRYTAGVLKCWMSRRTAGVLQWRRRRCTAGELKWRRREEEMCCWCTQLEERGGKMYCCCTKWRRRRRRCTAGRLKWRRMRKCTAGVLKFGEEEMYCWCTQMLDE